MTSPFSPTPGGYGPQSGAYASVSGAYNNPFGRRNKPPLWLWFIGLGGVVAVVYYLLPLFHLGGSGQNVMYAGMSTAATVGVLVGVRVNRPPGRGPWLILASAQCSYTIGDVLYFVMHTINGSEAFPDISDVFYLLQYPLISLALIVFVRRRTPRWRGAALIDAMIVAIAATVVWWIYLIGPLTTASDESALSSAVSVAYPVMDLLVLAVALRLALGAGSRTVSFKLLLISLVLMLAADTVYAALTASNQYNDGSPMDILWLGSYTLLGAAALHPSMRWMDQRAQASAPMVGMRRLVVLSAACLLPLAVLLIQYYRRVSIDAPIIIVAAAILFVLMMFRMRGMAALQRRVAIVDDLTGLLAYDFSVEALRVECERIAGTRDELAMLLIDADQFGLINETYGHAAGDRVLCELANRVRAVCRGGDLVGRYDGGGGDGDMLIAVLPGADGREAPVLAERIRDAVSLVPIQVDDATRVRITVSIGMARMPADARTPDELRLFAERCLMAAKGGGRNRTVGRNGPVNPEMLAYQRTGSHGFG